MSTPKVLFGFHAVGVRLRTAPRSILEVYVDTGRRDARMRQFLERAREANLLLGLSAQTLEEALEADNEHPDYLGAGPIWATPIKPGVPALGLDGLAELCESVAAPVVAIGGVDATNAALCLEAGAIGVAVVRASTDAAAVRTALERAAV